MTRGILGRALLCTGLLAAWAVPAHAQAIGSIFGKVTDASGGVLPGVDGHRDRHRAPAAARSTTTESGTYQFPSVPIGTYTVTFELQLQEGRPEQRRHHDRLQRRHRPEARDRADVGRGHGLGGGAGRRHQEDHHRRDVHRRRPREDPDRARPVADHQHDAGRAGRRLNVGGSPSGQQVASVARHRANVQWNLEGGSITDLSSNSSPSYFNFDSFDQIQVTNGGGDVSVQSSGLAINLVTKSGSNVFKGSAVGTFENDAMQAQQRHRGAVQRRRQRLPLGQPAQEDRRRTRSSTAARS